MVTMSQAVKEAFGEGGGAQRGPRRCRRRPSRPSRHRLAWQDTRATDGTSNMLRNTETPSTMLDRILLSRVFQSWTYQRCTASTRSRISCAVVLSTRSRSCVIVCC